MSESFCQPSMKHIAEDAIGKGYHRLVKSLYLRVYAQDVASVVTAVECLHWLHGDLLLQGCPSQSG